MIVKCDKCQTRFKIPDDKVTEKGVKVRCTKCSNTFRVYRGADGNAAYTPPADGGPPAAAKPSPRPSPANAPALPESDPFAQFAPAPEPPAGQTTKPGFYAAGVEATRGGPQAAASGPKDLSDIFGEPTHVTAAPAPAPAPRPAPAPVLKAGADLSAVLAGPRARSATEQAAGALSKLPPPPAKGPEAAFDFGGPSLADLPPGPTEPSPAASREELFGDGGFLTSSAQNPVVPAGPPDRGLFDIPEPPPAPPPAAMPEPVSMPDAEPAAVARMTRPAGRPEDARGLEEAPSRGPGAARRLSGVVVNVAVSAVLLLVMVAIGGVYLNEGKLDLSALSVSRLGELLAPPRQLTVVDVSNGLYETRRGRAVFYIRGEVENRTGAPARAQVKAQILDGDQLVRAAEGWAGRVPTPEELHAVESAEDVAKLSQHLARGAVELAPGARAPFLVAFYEYPPNLSAFRLQVTVAQDGPARASQ